MRIRQESGGSNDSSGNSRREREGDEKGGEEFNGRKAGESQANRNK